MSSETYDALRQHAAWFDRDTRGLIAVAGADRLEYLQGQLTNDIAVVTDGHGCYAAYLTPQGRLVADLEVLGVGARVLLDVHRTVKDALVSRLRELVFTEDVEIDDWSDTWTSLGVAGPRAAGELAGALQALDAGIGEPAVSALQDHEVAHAPLGEGRLVVARTDAIGIVQYDVWAPAEAIRTLRDALVEARCRHADAETLHAVRVEQGRPAFPGDLDESTIPLEAGIEDRALSFTKGCYVGQEVIIRVVHRGQGRVARRLVGLTLDATDVAGAPRPGARLMRNGTEVGRLTSVAWSPARRRVVAMGYVSRDLTEPGTSVAADGPGGSIDATVTRLPFVAAVDDP